MAKKKEVEVVEEVVTVEEVAAEVELTEFQKMHTGAQDNVIYG